MKAVQIMSFGTPDVLQVNDVDRPAPGPGEVLVRVEATSVNGHDTIVFFLTPRPNAKPRTSEGNQMRNLSVRAWVSESEKELVRLDAEVLDTLSLGFGFLARLHKGAKLTFQRTKVNNEVWLPSRVTYSGSARIGLVAVLRRNGSSEFSGYRKFSVDTSTTYQAPTP